jgi:hypothetical protein
MIDHGATAGVRAMDTDLEESRDDVPILVSPTDKGLVETVHGHEIRSPEDHVATPNAMQTARPKERPGKSQGVLDVSEMATMAEDPTRIEDPLG